VADIAPGAFNSSPYEFTVLGGYLYFVANDGTGTTGNELWRTNGTITTLFADIDPGPGASNPAALITFGDYIYFQGFDSTFGSELWRTDGTALGTMRIATMSPDVDFVGPNYFTALGDYLYFTTYNGNRNYVYRTDGTVTEHIPFPSDADQYISCDCYDTNLVAVGGRLFSTMYSAATGNEFAYLDEPTYVLPPTNRDGSVWTVTLVILAGLTAAASIGLRVRGAKRA
jgi:ELWxxDGT repeat protein